MTGTLDWDEKGFLLVPPYSAHKAIQDSLQARRLPTGAYRLPDICLYADTALEMFPGLALTEIADARLRGPQHQDLGSEMIPTGQAKRVWDQFYPYQQDAVARLVAGYKQSQLLVLSPGLGKTVVSLYAARLLCARRVLVVTLKDLIRQWEDEEEKWFKERTLQRLYGEPPPYNVEGWKGWYVANYDTVVGRLHPDFKAVKWDVVILDESVMVKNRKTVRFKKLLKLRPKSEFWWELTGSPTTRYTDDLHAQLRLAEPGAFRSYWRFAERYTHVTQTVWGTEISGSRLDRDPVHDLRDLIFVRNQQDVLPSLPEEIPQLVTVQMTPKQAKAYKAMADDWIVELDSGVKVESAAILGQLIRLQEIASNLINIGGEDESAKSNAVVNLLNAQAFEFPAIIWVQWLKGGAALLGRLRSAAPHLRIEWVHGATSKKQEELNEQTFLDYKAGKIDILVLGLPVGKFGQNLQMTKTIIYHEKTWNGDDFFQSIKRVRRIGLQHRPLLITLKAQGTVDEMVEDNLAGKLPSISKITQENLASLLRNLTGQI